MKAAIVAGGSCGRHILDRIEFDPHSFLATTPNPLSSKYFAPALTTFRRKIDVFGSTVNGLRPSKDRGAAGGVFAGLWL
jgi:hypothetical protein